MQNNYNPEVSSDRQDYQHDVFVVDWACVTSKKEKV